MTNVNRFLRRLCWHRAAWDDHTVRLNCHFNQRLTTLFYNKLSDIAFLQGLAAIEKLGQEALNEPKIYVSTILEVRFLCVHNPGVYILLCPLSWRCDSYGSTINADWKIECYYLVS